MNRVQTGGTDRSLLMELRAITRLLEQILARLEELVESKQ